MPKIFVNRFPKIHSHDPPLLFHTPPFSLAQTPPRSLLPCINTNPSSCLSRAPPPPGGGRSRDRTDLWVLEYESFQFWVFLFSVVTVESWWGCGCCGGMTRGGVCLFLVEYEFLCFRFFRFGYLMFVVVTVVVVAWGHVGAQSLIRYGQCFL